VEVIVDTWTSRTSPVPASEKATPGLPALYRLYQLYQAVKRGRQVPAGPPGFWGFNGKINKDKWRGGESASSDYAPRCPQ
jgi:hypothetical protein